MTWFEYILENARRQEDLAGEDPAKVDLRLRQEVAIQSLLLLERMTAEEVVAKHPDLRERLFEVWTDGKSIAGRNLAFFRQLAAKNLAEAWGRFDGHALVVWGEADYVSGRSDHELIARLVNRSHPGHGRFLALAESDHGLARARSQAESFAWTRTGGGEFNPAIIDALLGWGDEVTGRARGSR
jgi:hypothetical protein